jgi:hypothetical protein
MVTAVAGQRWSRYRCRYCRWRIRWHKWVWRRTIWRWWVIVTAVAGQRWSRYRCRCCRWRIGWHNWVWRCTIWRWWVIVITVAEQRWFRYRCRCCRWRIARKNRRDITIIPKVLIKIVNFFFIYFFANTFKNSRYRCLRGTRTRARLTVCYIITCQKSFKIRQILPIYLPFYCVLPARSCSEYFLRI